MYIAVQYYIMKLPTDRSL